ncbi:MAG: hypothetical protein GY729_14680 [Desulfobacteraceae bacterium]|nr:hypothetical protein [Desulfobacteraceae bacterium]
MNAYLKAVVPNDDVVFDVSLAVQTYKDFLSIQLLGKHSKQPGNLFDLILDYISCCDNYSPRNAGFDFQWQHHWN